MKVNKTYLILFLIFILALLARLIFIPQNFLFGFEQGRDAQIAQDIIHLRKLTLIGPKTDIAGIFHGVWYYYILSIFYIIGNGSPLISLIFLIVLNSLTTIILYFSTFEITGSKKISLLSSLIFALSFNAIIYARWLSNVSPSIFFSSIFFYMLIKYIKEEKMKYWILLIASFCFLFHFELLNGLYGGFLLLVLLILLRYKVTLSRFLLAAGIFMVINFPFIFFDLRHQGILSKSILGYLIKPEHKEVKGNIFVYLQGLFGEISRTLFPQNNLLLILFLLIIFGGFIYYFFQNKKSVNKKIPVLLFFSILWSAPYIFLIKEYPLDHFYAGTTIPIILAVCYLIQNNTQLIKKFVIVLLPFWIIFNSIYIYNALSHVTNIFYHAVQNKLNFKDQLSVMDYIFSYSKEEFHYAAFTIPYYMQDSWQYLYSWYGNEKYKGMIQKNSENKRKKYTFLIIEPSTQGYWLTRWLKSYDKESTTISSRMFGSIQVIVRKNTVN